MRCRPCVRKEIDVTDRVAIVKARNQFADLINRVVYGKERMILSRRGRELAGLVPLEDMKLLEELENRLDLEEARAALKAAAEKGTVSWTSLKAELGL